MYLYIHLLIQPIYLLAKRYYNHIAVRFFRVHGVFLVPWTHLRQRHDLRDVFPEEMWFGQVLLLKLRARPGVPMENRARGRAGRIRAPWKREEPT